MKSPCDIASRIGTSAAAGAGICAMLLLLLRPHPLAGAENGQGDLWGNELTPTTNIHNDASHCQRCHERGDRNQFLPQTRFGTDFRSGCSCHYEAPQHVLHPTDAIMSPEIQGRIPAEFPVADGKIQCVTCHNMAPLCREEGKGTGGRAALRGAPYPDRTAFCFRCHDPARYERLSPHNQLDATGEIQEKTCHYCHVDTPDERESTFKTIKLVGEVEMLCQGCHNVSDSHCGGAPHNVKPPDEWLLRIKTLEIRYGMVLPLREDGTMTCITCHNPHEEGVIPSTLVGAKGAGQKFRHRLPDRLCAECHRK